MAELFKFRCYQCQKLLGAPISRIGSTTNCPKCGTGLVVPTPFVDEDADGDEEDEDTESVNLDILGLKLDAELLSKPTLVKPPEAGPSPVAFLERLQEEPEMDPDLEAEVEPAPSIEGPEDTLAASARARRGRAGRSSDIVFPRTAAITWSLFGLLALASAFVSGILIGHFLWK